MDFCFFSSIYVQFSKTSPINLEKVAKNPVEKITSNPVTSVAVMVFSALIFFCCLSCVYLSCRPKKEPKPNFLVRISSGGVGVFHVKRWGPKSSV